MNIVIGIDPDADKNGVALYKDGTLSLLTSMKTLEFYFFLETLKKKNYVENILVGIENVKLLSITFERKNNKAGQRGHDRISHNVGQCKHAQTEIENCCKHLNVKYILFRPSSNFKKGSSIKMFERLTGYKGSSNADQRSAAYFGLQALKKV